MAYYNNSAQANSNTQGMNEQDEEDQKNGLQPASITQGATAASANGAVGTQNMSQTKAPPKSASSGMGGGFQAYTKANQGAAQNRLNQATAQNVTRQGQAAQTGINQATTQFGQRADAGTLANRDKATQDVAAAVAAARGATAAPAQPQLQTGTGTVQASQGNFEGGKEQITAAQNSAQGLSPEQTSRFQEVINAKYQGPESLRQAGLYDLASKKVGQAQTAIDQSKTAQGREELLRNMFQNRGTYTQGQNKLDAALLNASQSGVQNLLGAAQAQGNLGQKLDQAQLSSANLAQNRTQEIQNIQNQARDVFNTQQAAERKATDDRLATVVQDWDKLPEYFKNIIRNNPKGALNLSQQEADILGIRSGEGLYNLGEEAIRTNAADKAKLVTRDEVARQQALAQLAGLDLSNRLSTNVAYGMDKAGTQTANDAINREGIRSALSEAEKGFQDYAKEADLIGYGNKKHRQTGKRYYAEETANLADVLNRAGYNFDKAQTIADSAVKDQSYGNTAYENTGLDTQGKLVREEGFDSDYTNDLDTLTDPYTNNSSLANKAIYAVGDLFGAGGLRNLGIDVMGPISEALGAQVSSKYAKNIAEQLAQQDLQNKIMSSLDTQGFQNRALVGDSSQTQSRASGLQALLDNIAKNKG